MAHPLGSRFPADVTSLSFFFDCFRNSDEAAEYVIRNDRGPGTFLLRPSTRTPNTLTITISISNNYARHVNVQYVKDDSSPTGVRFFIIIERSFSSFHDLYAHYTTNPITNLEQIDNVQLLNPLTRSELNRRPLEPVPLPEQVSLIPMDIDIPPLPVKAEIPPLPRKRPSETERALPEVPTEAKGERSSLDSEGNEHRTSSSSNGSGTIRASVASNPGGAVGGVDVNGVGQLGNQEQDSGFARSSFSSDSLPRDKAAFVVNFTKPEDLTPVQAEGGVNFYLGPQQFTYAPTSPTSSGGSVPLPLPVPMSKADEKRTQKEKKQLKKEEKMKQKEEKRKKKEDERKKKNQKALSDLGWCRPPQPLPVPTIPVDDDSPYYTTPRPYRNHLEELKTMLRESEICDCGLRMMDAELADGWTVHRSREQATYLRVFYQHENGNTTWVFPQSIAHLISTRQVHFILRLCQDANIEQPEILLGRLEHPEGYYPQRSPPPEARSPSSGMYLSQSKTSVSSMRSRSSSNSSSQGVDMFGSNMSLSASMDQRRPMPRPGEGRPY